MVSTHNGQFSQADELLRPLHLPDVKKSDQFCRELVTGEATCVVSMLDNETIVTEKGGNTHHFTYDYSFWSFDKFGGPFASELTFGVL